MPSWDRVGSFAKMEVQSRQILNNEHALQRSKQLGADWLVHLDSDELLCLPKAAPAFFSEMAAKGCTMYIFNNVEGVPETCDSTDVLRSVRVFKQNFGLIPRNPAAGLVMFDWQLKLGGYFFSYENGKCAVRVKHAVKCLSVCMWAVEPQIEPGKKSRPDGSTTTWFTNNLRLYDGALKHRKEGLMHREEEVPRLHHCPEAFILHFCVCEFSAFWRKRWTQLGYLSASEQFRVRTSSGAMMARFYRLQHEGCQAEARQIYNSMCIVSGEENLATQLSSKVLIRADPEKLAGSPSGPKGYLGSGSGWVPARRPVRYDALAARAEARGAHIDAWLLLGKALEASSSGAIQQRAAQHRRRAAAAVAAGLASCAPVDSAAALALGDTAVWLPHVQAMEALGFVSEAVELAQKGLAALDDAESNSDGSAVTKRDLSALKDRLGQKMCQGASASKSKEVRELPTVGQLQEYVGRASRPDIKDSPVYRAVLAVAIAWWQEVGGNEKIFPNALARAAITVRAELTAVVEAVKPRPVRQIRAIWDPHEDEFQQKGAMATEMASDVELWRSVSQLCHQLLAGKESTVVKGCDKQSNPLYCIFPIFEGLVAEIRRVFEIHQVLVLSEMRISRPRQSAPEIDNGGLHPDNRREASMRIYVADIKAGLPHSRSPGLLTLGTKDGEQALSFELRSGRIFLWWSRSTFYQVLDGDAYFEISCWAVLPQKGDRPSEGPRTADPSKFKEKC
mmetsp:Transcript_48283/g.90438  ORF Transcript_48283/g.90438 Transcript_48283/m.90438 type:complete len:734 (-) Transcript_48283:11-2212(-)